jgi:hypothetical protein
MQMHMYDKATSYYEMAVFSDPGNMALMQKTYSYADRNACDLAEARNASLNC